ncbi:MAG: heme exporter protein CcmD [Sphingomonadaceae bacterium]|nr:heme exporter protein CcmD [Sphingomonadaceae bacterium]
MPHAPFIIAAFAVTAVGMAWLVLSSYLSMRRSEALANDLRQER